MTAVSTAPTVADFCAAYIETGLKPIWDQTFAVRDGMRCACPLGALAVSKGLEFQYIKTGPEALTISPHATFGHMMSLLGLEDRQIGSFLRGLRPPGRDGKAYPHTDSDWFRAGEAARRAFFEPSN